MTGFPEPGFLLDRHRAILGGVALVRGDAATATTILGTLFDEQVALTGRESLQGRYSGDLVEAAVAAGDLARAEAVTAALASDERTTPRPWARVMAARGTALALGARGDLDAADAAARRAIEAAEELPMPVERARTALIAGRIARRRKDRARARIPPRRGGRRASPRSGRRPGGRSRRRRRRGSDAARARRTS